MLEQRYLELTRIRYTDIITGIHSFVVFLAAAFHNLVSVRLAD